MYPLYNEVYIEDDFQELYFILILCVLEELGEVLIIFAFNFLFFNS